MRRQRHGRARERFVSTIQSLLNRLRLSCCSSPELVRFPTAVLLPCVALFLRPQLIERRPLIIRGLAHGSDLAAGERSGPDNSPLMDNVMGLAWQPPVADRGIEGGAISVNFEMPCRWRKFCNNFETTPAATAMDRQTTFRSS